MKLKALIITCILASVTTGCVVTTTVARKDVAACGCTCKKCKCGDGHKKCCEKTVVKLPEPIIIEEE